MSKRQDELPSLFNLDSLPVMPFNLFAPWLKAQASMVTTMKRMSDHWFDRRAADLAMWQEASGRIADCKTTTNLVEVQQQCASALADRFMSDLSALQADMMSLGESAGSAFGDLGLKPSQAASPRKTVAAD